MLELLRSWAYPDPCAQHDLRAIACSGQQVQKHTVAATSHEPTGIEPSTSLSDCFFAHKSHSFNPQAFRTVTSLPKQETLNHQP